MADTITLRTSTDRDVIKIVERGPQGPAGGGGGGGSGTVTSVALAGTGLSITGSPVTTSGTITANVTYGTTAGTACQGNDGRIANIKSSSITTVDSSEGGIGGTINLSGWENANGGSLIMNAEGYGNGGSINTSDGGGSISTTQSGGSINTSNGGGSIDTRGTGSIQFGIAGTRTTLTGTATADRAISLPDMGGELIVQNNSSIYTYNGDITIGDIGGIGGISGFGRTINFEDNNISGFNIASSGSISGSGLTQATDRILGRTTAGTGAVEEITVSGGASLSAGALTVHSQSHAITSTSDHTAGNNKVFYSNSSGQVTELALGAANTVLTSNGATSAPSFAAVSAGATNLWIPASAWIPRTTTGCGVDSTELSTNKVNTDQLLFDTATEEYAQALVMMPSNYNYGTITARFYWTASSGSGGVAFGLRGRAYADDDALDQAQGTGQVTTDTFIVADDLHVTAATSAITLAGTPAANRPVQFEIYRQVSNASDTLGVDARLLGVEVIFN